MGLCRLSPSTLQSAKSKRVLSLQSPAVDNSEAKVQCAPNAPPLSTLPRQDDVQPNKSYTIQIGQSCMDLHFQAAGNSSQYICLIGGDFPQSLYID